MEEQLKEEFATEEQENIVQEEVIQTENESEEGKKKKTKKEKSSKTGKMIIKILVPVLIIAIIVGVIIVVVLKKKEDDKVSGELVYAESIENLLGLGFYENNRYMGIVESQETKDIQKASDKTVKTVYVAEGDVVKEGDPLFEYDTEEMNLKLKQLELELQSIYSSINTTNQQITALAEEKETVPEENKIEYTAQIQSLQAQINQLNYDASAKQLEIDRQKVAIENAVVFSPMDGIIKTINDGTNQESQEDYYYYGETDTSSAYMSIMAMGNYRIKGTVSELNIYSLYEGMDVIIRSRVDDEIIWNGTISLVDTEHPESNNNDYYYYDSGNSATKYPFYVELDSIDGLILGQHVYIELDYGQTKEGLWLDDWYIINEDGETYVWAEDSDGKIEKRKVELGEYDEEMWRYEILSGLTEEDYIAFPEPRIKEGMTVTHNYEDVMEYEDDMMYDEDLMFDEEILYDDELMYDEDMMFDEDIMYDEDMMLDEDMMYDEDMMLDEDMMYDEDMMLDEEIIEEESAVSEEDAQ